MRCLVGRVSAVFLGGLSLVWLVSPAVAQMQLAPAGPEVQTVVSARNTLGQFSGLQIESIPQGMLAQAEGIAIFPNMIKGGFIFAGNYGKGVIMVRNADRSWSPPALCSMGGGSLGFQVGVQAADIVLIFATPQSLRNLLQGNKVTLGADASVALGPIGRQANAGTDARLGAEIYSYARSRGLFLGVSVSGADISIDNNANSMLYGRFGVTPDDIFNNRGLALRPEVVQLVVDLNTKSAAQSQAPAFSATPTEVVVPTAGLQGATTVPEPLPPGTLPTGAPSTLPLQTVPLQPVPSPGGLPGAVPQQLPGLPRPAASVPQSADPPLVPIKPAG